MKNKLLACFLFFLSLYVSAQKAGRQIEINPFLRWDSYPKFIYAINQVTSNSVQLKGTSWGLNAAYKLPVGDKFYLKAGLGYYKYSFNKIDAFNTLFGKGDKRTIYFDPPNPFSSRFLYATGKYSYNTATGTVGIERQFDIGKNVVIAGGANVTNYYTLSQRYHMLAIGKNYKKATGRYFGFSANLNASIQKTFGKIGVGPNLLLPVYDNWKKDKVFPQEQNNKSRDKWFRGIGIGLTGIYSLSNKH